MILRCQDQSLIRLLAEIHKTEEKGSSAFRKYDRAHKRSVILNIEEFFTDTSNPENFWDYVKKLGPNIREKVIYQWK